MEKMVLLIFSLLLLSPIVHGWGIDGHLTVCRIAQERLNRAAKAAVKELLPESAGGDLGSVCSWADKVKFRYHWSSPLHYIDTPDEACSYEYKRDCIDHETGEEDRCVAGAVNNYTAQLRTYNTRSSPSRGDYNLTEALLFLSHYMGDIHQPLHVGFTSDRGANTIDVHWYTRKTVLHHVWDANIIETAETRFFDSNVDDMIGAIQKNISGVWADQVDSWETCSGRNTSCPDKYATEGIKAACAWAYKDVTEDSLLEDEYFLSRWPIVTLRLAQGGVRLASLLNRIFS